LGLQVAEKREDRGIRQVAKEIGISPATLSRVEHGNLPDLETFGKVCRWLGVDPGDVLGFGGSVKRSVASVHFKKTAAVNIDTAKALSELILHAHKSLILLQGMGDEKSSV
jgi:transcriptional regulator with XRE-family HTH domain